MTAVLTRREGAVLLVTINRPQAANAIDRAVGEGIEAALRDAAADRDVGAVVLTGAGSRVFSAGADLKAGAELPPLGLAARRGAVLAGVLDAVLSFGKPLVAAVNGAAAGAGAMLALLADQVLAAEGARFMLPEIEHGMPTPIGLAILTELGGSALAADLVLSGRAMAAEEAARRGLARLVPAGSLEAEALAAARTLAGKPALAFALDKRWLQRRRRAAIEDAERDTQAFRLETLTAAEAG